MHIYEEEGFFEKHKDTQHGDSHIATFLLGLGVNMKEGIYASKMKMERRQRLALSPKNSNNEDIEDDDEENPNDKYLQWAAFYRDCPHSVEPVLKGTRIVLQYDVHAKPTSNSIIKWCYTDYDKERFQN
jgi:hypothetical protein